MDSQGLWQWAQRSSRVLLTAVADVLLPSSCALCAGPCPGVLCAPCRSQYSQPRRRCIQCANPLAGHEPVARCGACIKAVPAYDATVAAVDYAAPFDALVLQLKFGAQLALAPMCAQLVRDAMLGRAGLDVPDNLPDVLCPVPLGPRRLVERGFNQALVIARPLARALGVPLAARLLARPVDTPAQSTMAPAARRANVRRAFVVEGDVDGKHVGVVDDVMTSGHTLHAVARALKRAGAVRVTNLVFARTPPHD